MKKVISIFIKDETYMLTLVLERVAKNEISNAQKHIKRSKFEWPHDDTHDGRPIKIEKLYFRPIHQDYSPV